MTRLKPCPFCGNTNIFLGSILRANDYQPGIDDKYDMTHYVAVCDYVMGGCGAMTGKNNKTELEAEVAWNTRIK